LSFFVIHADIACAFPLQGMLDAHSKHRGLCTLLGTKVRRTTIKVYHSL
jgi:mannose-1-phosphate guanylyltransferase